MCPKLVKMESYEMVRNFKAFVTFAVKKLEALYAYVSPENFFDYAYVSPPSTTFSEKICTTWSKS